jgi:glycosyltransferase involved in cell wall biosynthesis
MNDSLITQQPTPVREGGRRVANVPRAFDPRLPTISVVTPVFNGARFLEDALQSIHGQDYPNVEHIVMDGGSTDATISILEQWSDRIDYWSSAPDRGMYDALAKGFDRTTGAILSWLNADDMYLPWTFRSVAAAFRNNDVHWVTGTASQWSPDGVNFHLPVVTKCYPRSLIRAGLFHGQGLGHIQQESTFWTRSLWERSGGLDTHFRYAGDYHLWKEFARHERLFTTNTLLAGFRVHGEQLSLGEGYEREVGDDVNALSRALGRARFAVVPLVTMFCRGSHLVRYSADDDLLVGRRLRP